jgi:hypothetical protein
MPGFDGTGPLGQGPMTGQGRGFCVLTSSEGNSNEMQGVAGLQAVPFSQKIRNFENTVKEVINMPRGDGTGPAGMGPMTGRAAGFCAGYPVPGYMNPAGGAGWVNPAVGRAGFYGAGMPAVGPYGAGAYGYGMPYGGWGRRGFGRGFGRRWGRGRGRGRFGYW